MAKKMGVSANNADRAGAGRAGADPAAGRTWRARPASRA